MSASIVPCLPLRHSVVIPVEPVSEVTPWKIRWIQVRLVVGYGSRRDDRRPDEEESGPDKHKENSRAIVVTM